MFVAAALAVLVTMSLAMIRALRGPTVYDRILALNVFGTKTVLLIAVLGFLTGRPDFLDLALVYALINFIGVIAMLKFFEYGDLATAGMESETTLSMAGASTTSMPSEAGAEDTTRGGSGGKSAGGGRTGSRGEGEGGDRWS